MAPNGVALTKRHQSHFRGTPIDPSVQLAHLLRSTVFTDENCEETHFGGKYEDRFFVFDILIFYLSLPSL